jgi:hypothetical protein
MGIGREFLCGGDVMGVPGEQKAERGVDEAAKDRWVENMLPHEGGGEDGTTAKDEEKESRRSFHEAVNERRRKTSWTHCGCESDEHVYFLVQLGVNAEGGEGLGSPLAETNITETRGAGYLENIFNRVGYIVPGKVVDREVPKLGRAGVMVNGLFGVLVASIVA